MKSSKNATSIEHSTLIAKANNNGGINAIKGCVDWRIKHNIIQDIRDVASYSV